MIDTFIPKCISHIRKNNDGIIEAFQSNEEHSLGVAKLAMQFADEFGMGDWGYVLGILHDKGKEKKEFQEYIRNINGMLGHKRWTQKGKAHSYVGAILANELYPEYFPIMSQPIMGHHGNLQNYYDFRRSMSQSMPAEVHKPKEITPLQNVKTIESIDNEFYFSVFMRMLFSCLKDADILDTEKFMNHVKPQSYAKCSTLQELLPRLISKLQELSNNNSHVNRIRKRVQDWCIQESEGEKGFYWLTVPTGGGKTLSSVLWAMKHAIHNGQKRIIIAIPFTSIIVQTAKILKGIFGEENVLEHHCNFFVDEETDNEELKERICAAMTNWDYPIIVTTNVQLFESMFSNKVSDCRKLHNIANSVIILDEVQALPTAYINPILKMLETYKNYFGVSVLFMTASQPILCGTYKSWNNKIFEGIAPEEWHEIIPSTEMLHDKLRRVKIKVEKNEFSYDDIAQTLCKYPRVLCIVNSRKDAKEIFDKLPKEGRFHLSRLMCPVDVQIKIDKIKEALQSDAPIVRVVSTQLVEAGVDLDFPVVFRQEAGLDSILQAAGRCNREGKNDIGQTYVFKLDHRPTKGTLSDAINAFNLFKQDNYEDWLSPEAMNDYFKWLYKEADFDKENIKKECGWDNREDCPAINFETIHQKFKLVENDGVGIIVLTKNNMELLRQIKAEDNIEPQKLRLLGKYTVNISRRGFEKLLSQGLLEEMIPLSNIYQTISVDQYNLDVGLVFDNIFLNELLIK